ncbi:MAG TPA: LysR family transcriptional regulator [Candidatus Pelethocola excrementipullorum]|nr:LysR family transcriptional regulator [Candidatus Pelethocola excrementipullorum]
MDFRKLEYFIAVCRRKSFVKAAEELHVSQPSVTTSIRNLEEELGMVLILRKRGGVEMTPEGKLLYEYGQKILEDIEAVKRQMKSISQNHKILRIGMPPLMQSNPFLDLIEEFQKENENIEVTIIDHNTKDIVEQLKDGKIELCILAVFDELDKGLSGVTIGEGKICACIDERHKLAKEPAIPIEALGGETIIKPGLEVFRSGFLCSMVNKECNKRGFSLKEGKTIAQLSRYFWDITNNNYVGFFYDDLWHKGVQEYLGEAKVQTVLRKPLLPEFNYEVVIAWNDEKKLSRCADQFIKLAKTKEAALH